MRRLRILWVRLKPGRSWLDSGRLVAPFAQSVRTGKRYCVIHSAGALADPRVATVHDWLVAEACAAELAAAPSADAASTPGE